MVTVVRLELSVAVTIELNTSHKGVVLGFYILELYEHAQPAQCVQ